MTVYFGRHSLIQHAVEVGDYFEALGVDRQAKKLDIDVAAARLAHSHLREARLVKAVAAFLNHTDSRTVYDLACHLRDRVMGNLVSRHGPRLGHVVPDLKRRVWAACCGLLQLNLDNGQLRVGPRGVASLVSEGETWVAESVLDAALVAIFPTAVERRGAEVSREVWYIDCPICHETRQVSCRRLVEGQDTRPKADLLVNDRLRVIPCDRFDEAKYDYLRTRCRNCGSSEGRPSEYNGTFTFSLPVSDSGDTLVEGQRQGNGRMELAVVNGVTQSRPLHLLHRFYQLQQEGEDITLDDVRRRTWNKIPFHPSAPSTEADRSSSTYPPLVLRLVLMAMGIIFGLVVTINRPNRNVNSHLETLTPQDPKSITAPPVGPAERKREHSRKNRAGPPSVPAAELLASMADNMAKSQPDSQRAQEGRAYAYLTLGQSWAAEGRRDRAGELFHETIEIVDGLLSQHPDSVDCFLFKGRAHQGIASMYRADNKPDEAIVHSRSCVDAFEMLRRRSSTPGKFDVEYLGMQANLAIDKIALGQKEEALELLSSARARLEQILADDPSQTTARRFLQNIDRIEQKAETTSDTRQPGDADPS